MVQARKMTSVGSASIVFAGKSLPHIDRQARRFVLPEIGQGRTVDLFPLSGIYQFVAILSFPGPNRNEFDQQSYWGGEDNGSLFLYQIDTPSIGQLESGIDLAEQSKPDQVKMYEEKAGRPACRQGAIFAFPIPNVTWSEFQSVWSSITGFSLPKLEMKGYVNLFRSDHYFSGLLTEEDVELFWSICPPERLRFGQGILRAPGFPDINLNSGMHIIMPMRGLEKGG